MSWLLPEWCWISVAFVCLFPSHLMYDLLWGLVKWSRVRSYVIEGIVDSLATLVGLAAAYHIGLAPIGVAMIGASTCALSEGAALVIVGTPGLYTKEPQAVPEWWVCLGTCLMFPVFLLDVFAPVVTLWIWVG